MLYDLDCRYDARKSFYGKAKVEIKEDKKQKDYLLYSYGTLVASVAFIKNKNIICYEYFGRYSQTITRHQKEFFKQNGLSDKEIKELFNKGTLEIER